MKKIERKGWRIDVKWLCAIFATLSLTASLTSLAFYRAAGSPDLAKYQKNLLTNSFGMDPKLLGDSKGKPIDPKNYKIKIGSKEYTPQQLNSMPEKEIQQLMKEFDGKGMTPGQVPDMKAMDKVMKDSGKMMDPKILQEQMGAYAGQAMMPYMNNMLGDAAKGMFLTTFIFSLLGAIVFIIPMIGVSYRFGKLMSFGAVLFLSALPVFIVASMFKLGGGMFSALADANFGLFLGIIIVAKILMIIAIIMGIIAGLGSKGKTGTPPAQPVKQQPAPGN